MARKSVNHSAGDEKESVETSTDILINVLLDRSGSMGGKETDTIGNFNAFIKEQREIAGKATVSLVLFDERYKEVYINKAIEEVPELDSRTYFVRGSTALLDAVGKLIGSVDGVKNKPRKVLFLINTDGMENASREYTKAKIKEMVTERQQNHDWQFLFVGAGVDAFSDGAGMGLQPWQTFTASNTNAGFTNTASYSSAVTRTYRTTDAVGQALFSDSMDLVDFVPDPDAPVTAGLSADKKKKKKVNTTK